MNDLIVQENFDNPGLSFLPDLTKLTECSIEDLTKIVSTIEVNAFYTKGIVLKHIRENKRYKELGYKTFSNYTKDVFSFSKTYANYLINAVNVYDNFDNLGLSFLPNDEKQIRYIVKLPEEQQLEVWQEIAKDKVPTAKEVKQAVDKHLGKNNSTKKNKTITTSTTIDTTKYITIEEHNKIILEYEKACTEDIDRLMKENSELKSKLQFFEKDFIEPAPEKSTLLPRQIIFDFVKAKGNTIQCQALKNDTLDNEKLFGLFVKVREDYKTSTPPPAWDMAIINATGIL